MNSILQCLSQTEDLTAYFLKDRHREKIINNNLSKKNIKSDQLSPNYLKLIQKLWDKNSSIRSFSPRDFIRTIERMKPLFKQGQPGDSKDFIIFLLEQFHTELKQSVGKQANTDNHILNQCIKIIFL